MLVFDEADAIFGRRTEVSDSHDRYANQEVSYLLSRIEEHPGVVILTTNLLANIDEAFQRRIHVMIEFPEPGPGERSRLWQSVLPTELPVDDTVDLDGLAQRYPLSGAQIRDASLDAAYLAAANGHIVNQQHLVTGIQRQFEKAGRTAPR
jgi:SpoVK/Ycf46/Vps4 family AAA+-type ATPase